MKKFYYTRHGRTKWNIERKVCGRTDIELTEEGHKQAIEAANLIKENNYPITKIIVSPLKRAVETAKIIADINNLPIITEERIIERNFGEYEGKAYSDEFKKLVQRADYDFESGESAFQVAERIYEVLDEIGKSDDTYLMVAHNGLVRMVDSYFNGRDIERSADAFIKNCEIKEYEFE
ncbi:MAG: histidine phosphatase family protein [Firmicutes bacterium]|nr:histidine phosphatase family protein [Bacillota bacterium]